MFAPIIVSPTGQNVEVAVELNVAAKPKGGHQIWVNFPKNRRPI
jgi:hypothetical protein